MRTGRFLVLCNQYHVKFEDLPALNFAEIDDAKAEAIIKKAAEEKIRREKKAKSV